MRRTHGLFAAAFFALLTLLGVWPLWHQWSTAIPGGLEDTRLFLWNAWWVRYAMDVLHTSPFHTDYLFAPFGTSLVSHDFPLWTNLVTYVAQRGGFGLIAASNMWFVLTWALAGLCTFALVREVTGKTAPAMVGGLYTFTHSYMLARAMQNWGQLNVFGLALFLWLFVRARRVRSAAAFISAGAALAFLAACHYYFLIYGALIVLACLVTDFLPWRLQLQTSPTKTIWRMWAFGLAAIAAVVSALTLLFPGDYRIGPVFIGLHSLANPMIVGWLALASALAGRWHWRIARREGSGTHSSPSKTHYAAMIVTAGLLLSPLIVSAGRLALSGDYPNQHILWKTHPLGINLISPFMPNLHSIWGHALAEWSEHHDMQPQDQAGALGWVFLTIVIAAKFWREGGRSRKWLGLTLAATVCAMGVYAHVLWWNTWGPLPFYVLRLLPIVSNVRIPERWMAVEAVSGAVVLGLALVLLARRRNWPLGRTCFIAGALILIENWPGIPFVRPPAALPVYEVLRSAPTGVVLPIPFYVGDSSIGMGNAQGEGFAFPWDLLWAQTFFEKPMIGGYVGRISRRTLNNYKTDPMLGTILRIEEGGEDRHTGESRHPVDSRRLGPGLRRGDSISMTVDADVSYVLIYSNQTSDAVKKYVLDNFRMEKIAECPEALLYRVMRPTPAAPTPKE